MVSFFAAGPFENEFYFNPYFSFISSRYVLHTHRGFKSFLFGTAGGIYCLAFKVRGDHKRIMMSVSVNLRSNLHSIYIRVCQIF